MKAVVLLSGGQDSTTALYWALARKGFTGILALTIHYDQRHEVEVAAAREVVRAARAQHPGVDLVHEECAVGPVLAGTSPLVSSAELGQYDSAEQLPGGVEPTFIPGRNALFLTIAANRAHTIGARHIVIGVCEEDFGGYYDCRAPFVVAMEKALGEAIHGDPRALRIYAPLMSLTKSATVRLAADLPGCWLALAHSHTCYAGTTPPCGKCHACILRAEGFAQAGMADPLIERVSG